MTNNEKEALVKELFDETIAELREACPPERTREKAKEIAEQPDWMVNEQVAAFTNEIMTELTARLDASSTKPSGRTIEINGEPS